MHLCCCLEIRALSSKATSTNVFAIHKLQRTRIEVVWVAKRRFRRNTITQKEVFLKMYILQVLTPILLWHFVVTCDISIKLELLNLVSFIFLFYILPKKLTLLIIHQLITSHNFKCPSRYLTYRAHLCLLSFSNTFV